MKNRIFGETGREDKLRETILDDGVVETRRRQALRNAIWKSDYARTRRDRILMTWSRAVRPLHGGGYIAGQPRSVLLAFVVPAIPTRLR